MGGRPVNSCPQQRHKPVPEPSTAVNYNAVRLYGTAAAGGKVTFAAGWPELAWFVPECCGTETKDSPHSSHKIIMVKFLEVEYRGINSRSGGFRRGRRWAIRVGRSRRKLKVEQ